MRQEDSRNCSPMFFVPSWKDMGKDRGCFFAERTSEDAAGSTQSDGLNESRFTKICHGRMVDDEESLRI